MRALKVAVVVMAILLLAGFTVVVTELFRRAERQAPKPVPVATAPAVSTFGAVDIPIPSGCVLRDTIVSDNRLILRLGEGGACALIIILDAASGRELGRFKLTAMPQ